MPLPIMAEVEFAVRMGRGLIASYSTKSFMSNVKCVDAPESSNHITRFGVLVISSQDMEETSDIYSKPVTKFSSLGDTLQLRLCLVTVGLLALSKDHCAVFAYL